MSRTVKITSPSTTSSTIPTAPATPNSPSKLEWTLSDLQRFSSLSGHPGTKGTQTGKGGSRTGSTIYQHPITARSLGMLVLVLGGVFLMWLAVYSGSYIASLIINSKEHSVKQALSDDTGMKENVINSREGDVTLSKGSSVLLPTTTAGEEEEEEDIREKVRGSAAYDDYLINVPEEMEKMENESQQEEEEEEGGMQQGGQERQELKGEDRREMIDRMGEVKERAELAQSSGLVVRTMNSFVTFKDIIVELFLNLFNLIFRI